MHNALTMRHDLKSHRNLNLFIVIDFPSIEHYVECIMWNSCMVQHSTWLKCIRNINQYGTTLSTTMSLKYVCLSSILFQQKMISESPFSVLRKKLKVNWFNYGISYQYFNV